MAVHRLRNHRNQSKRRNRKRRKRIRRRAPKPDRTQKMPNRVERTKEKMQLVRLPLSRLNQNRPHSRWAKSNCPAFWMFILLTFSLFQIYLYYFPVFLTNSPRLCFAPQIYINVPIYWIIFCTLEMKTSKLCMNVIYCWTTKNIEKYELKKKHCKGSAAAQKTRCISRAWTRTFSVNTAGERFLCVYAWSWLECGFLRFLTN